jgi:hypothetical protein
VKKTIIFVIIIFAVVAVFLFVFLYNLQNDISKISEKNIIKILQTNQDAKNYMQNYPDYKIDKKQILSKDDIIRGQNAQNFKEVYQSLELEDKRYIKVDLINSAGDRGMITVIDFKNKSVLKAYGIMLFKANSK